MDRRAAGSIIWGLLRLHFPRYAGVYSESATSRFEVPVLFLLINILLAVLIGGYAAGELHGTGLNKLGALSKKVRLVDLQMYLECDKCPWIL